MVVKTTLRDRRRIQTAREIQRTALSLALRQGYDNVTTEMIAAEAGMALTSSRCHCPSTTFTSHLPGWPGWWR